MSEVEQQPLLSEKPFSTIAIAWMIAFAWFAIFFNPLLFIVLLMSAMLLAKKQWVAALCLLTFSPMGLLFFMGVADYARGQAHFMFRGLASIEAYNIDPVYRCSSQGGGCFVQGGEVFIDGSYNLAVMCLVKTLGPQRDSYRGPYPTHEEAQHALEQGETIPFQDVENGIIKVGETTITLSDGVAKTLLYGSYYQFAASGVKVPAAVVTIYQKEVCLIRVPIFPSGLAKPSEYKTGLIDAKSGRAFAYYLTGSGGAQHIPASRWN